MRVLLIGAGGREHALALTLAKSPRLSALFIAPGNPGTAGHGTNVMLDLEDFSAIIDFCRIQAIDLVVVGPEKPLVAGLADALDAAGIAVFGPSKAAAQLEGSKDFTKNLCDAAGIPTATYASLSDLAAARAHVQKAGAPIVVKYDGLMAGKGVTVAETIPEALDALGALYAAEPQARVVIEEKLLGEEVSYFCFVSGETLLPLGSAQDHKRAFDGDLGPNTGGMGAYSPAPVLDRETEKRVLETIIAPAAAEMARRGTPYRGILFAGLMIGEDGPKLIEFNCRFGDPECQVLLLRLETDLLALLDEVARGRLTRTTIALRPQAALGIVMAAKGYPGAYRKGSRIKGLDDAAKDPHVTVFHAGTRQVGDEIVAEGGRVLTVAALGADLRAAREAAYRAVAAIDWPEGFCRRDIGEKGLGRGV